MMQKILSRLPIMTFLMTLLVGGLSGQSPSAKREARAGNEAYDSGEPQEALEHYEKAMKKGMGKPELRFNKGDALYQLEKYADAARSFEQVAMNSEQKSLKAKAYHNKGNAHFKAGKLKKSIDAYKEALRIDPSDEETRYNLALAQKLRKEQKKRKKNKKKQKKKKDQKKKGKRDQQQKGSENKKSGQKDQKKQGRKKDGNKKKKERSQQKGSKKGKQKGEKKKARSLSPKEIERLLKAIEAKEAKVQRKILRKKKEQKVDSKDVEKDW